MSTRIVKVGGSLFDWPRMPTALREWLAGQPTALNVLIAGGGALADAIRVADGRFHLAPETAHWLCIDAMSITARLLATVCPDFELLTTFEKLQQLHANTAAGTAVFDCQEFLRDHESQLPGVRLPRDWSVTSDSIAARIGMLLGADELVLLKSTDPPATVDGWAASGFVDSFFPTVSANLVFRAVNLRHSARPRKPPGGE